MTRKGFQLRRFLLGPGLCALLLAGMGFERRHYRNEVDFAPFHARAAKIINALPTAIGSWLGTDEGLSKEELDLLKPNAARRIRFVDTRVGADSSRTVVLMVIQCHRARNMGGHFPPNCYPAQGYIPVSDALVRNWIVDGLSIKGMEYRFEKADRGQVSPTTVYNFMVLPEQGIKPDMKAIYDSAEDYQQRYYGAAQVQVVFGGTLAEPQQQVERDKILVELLSPAVPAIQTLAKGVE